MSSANTCRRVAVLISGSGSNMSALIEAGRQPASTFEVALVISNQPKAGGLELAHSAGVRAIAIDHRSYGKDRAAHERIIDAELQKAGIEVVALAGYMRLLTPWLVRRWNGRMLNIHPSLLPSYPGLDTHARALDAGETQAGCTVHLVSEGVDEGPILGQMAVAILEDDTPHTLAQRVLASEHRLYPAVLGDFCRTLI